MADAPSEVPPGGKSPSDTSLQQSSLQRIEFESPLVPPPGKFRPVDNEVDSTNSLFDWENLLDLAQNCSPARIVAVRHLMKPYEHEWQSQLLAESADSLESSATMEQHRIILDVKARADAFMRTHYPCFPDRTMAVVRAVDFIYAEPLDETKARNDLLDCHVLFTLKEFSDMSVQELMVAYGLASANMWVVGEISAQIKAHNDRFELGRYGYVIPSYEDAGSSLPKDPSPDVGASNRQSTAIDFQSPEHPLYRIEDEEVTSFLKDWDDLNKILAPQASKSNFIAIQALVGPLADLNASSLATLDYRQTRAEFLKYSPHHRRLYSVARECVHPVYTEKDRAEVLSWMNGWRLLNDRLVHLTAPPRMTDLFEKYADTLRNLTDPRIRREWRMDLYKQLPCLDDYSFGPNYFDPSNVDDLDSYLEFAPHEWLCPDDFVADFGPLEIAISRVILSSEMLGDFGYASPTIPEHQKERLFHKYNPSLPALQAMRTFAKEGIPGIRIIQDNWKDTEDYYDQLSTELTNIASTVGPDTRRLQLINELSEVSIEAEDLDNMSTEEVKELYIKYSPCFSPVAPWHEDPCLVSCPNIVAAATAWMAICGERTNHQATFPVLQFQHLFYGLLRLSPCDVEEMDWIKSEQLYCAYKPLLPQLTAMVNLAFNSDCGCYDSMVSNHVVATWSTLANRVWEFRGFPFDPAMPVE